MLAPVLDRAAAGNPAVHFAKVDIDKHPELAEAHRVTSVPNVQFFSGGKKTGAFVGARDATFIQSFIKDSSL